MTKTRISDESLSWEINFVNGEYEWIVRREGITAQGFEMTPALAGEMIARELARVARMLTT